MLPAIKETASHGNRPCTHGTDFLMKKSTLEKYHKVKSDRTASTLSLHIPYVGMCDNARGSRKRENACAAMGRGGS